MDGFMKYLFFILPAHGHINPALAVAKELINRKKK
jgi:UDP:flavonoid glycosyltransferase YjiC (YdhE family)